MSCHGITASLNSINLLVSCDQLANPVGCAHAMMVGAHITCVAKNFAAFNMFPRKVHLRSAQVDDLQWQVFDLYMTLVGISVYWPLRMGVKSVRRLAFQDCL